MTSILYYSQYCDPSKNLLRDLAKTNLKEEVHFICIDDRTIDSSGKTILNLANNQRVILPPTVTKVPALLLLNQGHRVLFEQDIYDFFRPKQQIITHQATMGNGEPECYSLGQMNSMSDAYSFLDQSSDSLSAKGDGGIRQMHNYVSSYDESQMIQTPVDNYEPDKIGNNGSITMEQYKQQRELDVPLPISRN